MSAKYNHKNSFMPSNDKYLFLDMNSFFASCEQQLDSGLRGKPVVIAPYTGNTGCCIAVSYEAKALGIKTGMGVGEAKTIFPSIMVIEARPHIYRQFHHNLVAILNNFTPNLIVRSIDEMTFTLSSYEKEGDRPKQLALKIKKEITRKLGEQMTCSIGVGPNIFWAKQAAEEKKPDGLTIIRLENIPNYLKRWKLTDIKGIKYNMEKILNYVGIFTPLELYQSDKEILRKKLKITGEYWWYRLHGYNIDTAPTKRGHIGHSCVLPPEARNWKTASQIMRKLVERAGIRMRKEGYQAKGVIVYIRYLNAPSWHCYQRTSFYCDSDSFWQSVKFILDKCPKHKNPLLIGVTAVNLSQKNGEQLDLFSHRQKIKSIFSTLDLVNARFGKWTLKPASLIGTDEYAPSRISFGNTQL